MQYRVSLYVNYIDTRSNDPAFICESRCDFELKYAEWHGCFTNKLSASVSEEHAIGWMAASICCRFVDIGHAAHVFVPCLQFLFEELSVLCKNEVGAQFFCLFSVFHQLRYLHSARPWLIPPLALLYLYVLILKLLTYWLFRLRFIALLWLT
jgi:hypothetical protein